jgi:hypothetical protein
MVFTDSTGRVCIERGTIRVDGVSVGEANLGYFAGYHPAIEVTLGEREPFWIDVSDDERLQKIARAAIEYRDSQEKQAAE